MVKIVLLPVRAKNYLYLKSKNLAGLESNFISGFLMPGHIIIMMMK